MQQGTKVTECITGTVLEYTMVLYIAGMVYATLYCMVDGRIGLPFLAKYQPCG